MGSFRAEEFPHELLRELTGMIAFGATQLEPADCPDGKQSSSGMNAVVIGNAGGEMWTRFQDSAEHASGAPDPLDRWTDRVVSAFCCEIGVTPVFPFDRPWWPFQRIANRCAGTKRSPLGIVIHPEFGLWHAYRAMLLLEPVQDFVSQFNTILGLHQAMIHHPCEACADKPCLGACPVSAFDGTGSLDRANCKGHVYSGLDPVCSTLGCQARDACPVGAKWRYSDEQVRFHMDAFAPR